MNRLIDLAEAFDRREQQRHGAEEGDKHPGCHLIRRSACFQGKKNNHRRQRGNNRHFNNRRRPGGDLRRTHRMKTHRLRLTVKAGELKILTVINAHDRPPAQRLIHHMIHAAHILLYRPSHAAQLARYMDDDKR